MANEWYYTDSGQPRGPISTGALRERAASGALKPSDLVWQEGMSQWAPAQATRGLFSPPISRQPQESAAAPSAVSVTPRQDRYLRNPINDSGNEVPPGRDKRSGGIGTGAKVAVGGSLVLALLMAAAVGSVAYMVVNQAPIRHRVSVNSVPAPPVRKPMPNRGRVIIGGNQGGGAVPVGNRSYTITLNHDGDENVRFIQIEQNELVHITVTTTDWAGDFEPDVDLLIFDPQNIQIASDTGPEKDCDATFVAGQAGLYKIVIQLFEGNRVQCTVHY